MRILELLAWKYECCLSDFHYERFLLIVKEDIYQLEGFRLEDWKEVYAYIFYDDQDIQVESIDEVKDRIYARIMMKADENADISLCKN